MKTGHSTSIPVRSLTEYFPAGIAIGKMPFDDLQLPGEPEHSHRHDYHFFILMEQGYVQLEIDFKKYTIKKPTIIYIHPNQVHRMLKAGNGIASILVISNENLKPEYLKLLEDITPAAPLLLTAKNSPILLESVSLCINLFNRKNDQLYTSLLKDGCNTLIALILSQYLDQSTQSGKLSRADIITKTFSQELERNFTLSKRPAEYARLLHISTSYLNECVKHTTGSSVSLYIQQRIMLEAKRLLHHSDKSVKEIAAELGYEDHAYFSRLFTKATGSTALTFRKKNRD